MNSVMTGKCCDMFGRTVLNNRNRLVSSVAVTDLIPL